MASPRPKYDSKGKLIGYTYPGPDTPYGSGTIGGGPRPSTPMTPRPGMAPPPPQVVNRPNIDPGFLAKAQASGALPPPRPRPVDRGPGSGGAPDYGITFDPVRQGPPLEEMRAADLNRRTGNYVPPPPQLPSGPEPRPIRDRVVQPVTRPLTPLTPPTPQILQGPEPRPIRDRVVQPVAKLGFKKGGKVTAKAKAPVKKAAGGKVAAKAPVKKAMGGKVAAKPMSRPVAKAKPMARPMPAMKRGGKVMMKGKYK